MASVSAHVAHTLSAHVDHVFGVMGNGNAAFLDALHSHARAATRRCVTRPARSSPPTRTTAPRAGSPPRPPPTAPGSRTRSPRSPRPRRRASRSCSSWATRRRPAPAPGTSTRSRMAAAAGAPHLRRRPSGCRRHHVARDRARRSRTAPPSCSRSPTTSPPPTRATLTPPRRDHPAGAPPARRRRARRRRRAAGGSRAPVAPRGSRRLAVWRRRRASVGSPPPRAPSRRPRRSGAGSSPTPRSTSASPAGSAQEAAMRLVHEADVAVVFGASLNQFTMRFGELFAPGTQVVQVDVGAAATHPAVDAVRGGRRAPRGIRDRRPPRRARRSADADGASRSTFAPLRVREPGDGAHPTAGSTRAASRPGSPSCCREDRVVVSDGGHFIGWANMYWPVAAPDRMLMVGTAFQSIGLGFPSVPGAARGQARGDDRAHDRRRRRAHGARRPRERGAVGRRTRDRRRLERRRVQRRGAPVRTAGLRRRAHAHPRDRLRGPRRGGRRRGRRRARTRRPRPARDVGRRAGRRRAGSCCSTAASRGR